MTDRMIRTMIFSSADIPESLPGLKSKEISPSFARTAEDAVTMIENRPPDVIILCLFHHSDKSFFQYLITRKNKIPVIVLTESEKERNKALKKGAVAAWPLSIQSTDLSVAVKALNLFKTFD